LTAHKASHLLSCHLVHAAPIVRSISSAHAQLHQQNCLNKHYHSPTCSMIHAQAGDAHTQAEATPDACISSGIMQRLTQLLTLMQASPVRLAEAWQLCTCICCSQTAACAGPSCAPSYAALTQPQTCSPLELPLLIPGQSKLPVIALATVVIMESACRALLAIDFRCTTTWYVSNELSASPVWAAAAWSTC